MNDRRLGAGLEEIFGGARCPDVRYRVLQSWRRGRVRRAAARTARWGVATAGLLVVVLATILGPSKRAEARKGFGQDPTPRAIVETRVVPDSPAALAAFLKNVTRVEAEALALGGVAVSLSEGRTTRQAVPDQLARALIDGLELDTDRWVSAHVPLRARLVFRDDRGRALSALVAHDGRFAIEGLGDGRISTGQVELAAFLAGLERRAERELGAFRRALRLQEWRDGRAELPAWMPLGDQGEMLTAMDGVARVRHLDTSRAAWLDAASVRGMVERWQPTELRLDRGQVNDRLWRALADNPPLERFEVRYQHHFQGNLPMVGIGRRRCADCHRGGQQAPREKLPAIDWTVLAGTKEIHFESLSIDAQHLEGMGNVPDLRTLRLCGCGLKGLKGGAILGRLSVLRHLSLRGARGVPSLLPTLRNLRQLRILDVRESDLTAAQIDALRTALPKTQVWRY